MSIRFLLDTNVLSEPTFPLPHPGVMQRLQLHANEICTASIVLHELQYGCFRLPDSHKRRTLARYLLDVAGKIAIMPYDARAAEWHAAERARLEAIGRTPSYVDAQIAAVAVVNGLVLVTRNTADYAYVQGLRLENWHR